VVLDKSSKERKQPFGTKMSEVLESAEEEIRNLQDLVKQSHLCFIKTLRYFRHALPKKGKLEDIKPEEFFSSWLLFCQDNKTIWKKEKELILAQKEKDLNLKRKKREDLVAIYKWTDHGPLDVYRNFMIPVGEIVYIRHSWSLVPTALPRMSLSGGSLL
jgi:hypothetical protein